jgi:hypothetical protein
MREGSPSSYTSTNKGKSKEIALPENLNKVAPEVNQGRSHAHKKRRKESNTSSPLHGYAAPQHNAADTTTVQVRTQYFYILKLTLGKTKISKRAKVSQGSALPNDNMPKEDIKAVS